MAKVTWKLLDPDDPMFKKPFHVGRPILTRDLAAQKDAGADDDPVLRAGAEIIEHIHQNPAIMGMRSQLKRVFGYPEDDFDLAWASYALSLAAVGGKERDWNLDIEDLLRKGGLSDDQIMKARTDLPTAIYHRIILRVISEGWAKLGSPPGSAVGGVGEI